jgi:hypothetical protein
MNARGIANACVMLMVGVGAQGAGALPAPRIDAQTHVLTIAEESPAATPEAPTPAGAAQEPVYIGNEPLEACMERWDPGTHMTKEAWRQSCQRIRAEREPYVKGK